MDFQAGEDGKIPKKVLSDLGEGKIASCYLLYGEEEYLIKEALEKITDIILPAGDRTLNLFYMDGENEDVDRLCESLLTPPLIPGRKVVVLVNTRIFSSQKTLPDLVQKISDRYESNSDRLEAILRRGLPEGNHLIITAEEVDRKKRLFKTISDLGEVLYFPQVKGETRQKHMLMDTAKDLLVRRGKRLTPGAWVAIGKRTGFSLRNSMVAIEKLITYTGERIAIEEKDIEDVIGKTKEDTLFDLTTALAEKNLERALLTLKDLLEQGVHHLLILTMIIREIRFLLQAKIFINSGRLSPFNPHMDYNQFQKSVYPLIKEWSGYSGKKEGGEGLAASHPYVVYNALRNSERFSYKALVGYLEHLVDMDLALKSTMRDPKLLLEKFLIKVCG